MNEYKTYWLIDDKKITSFDAMRRKVRAGAIAIEVTATSQREAADARERHARLMAEQDEKLFKIAAQMEHDGSPEGKAEAARRSAFQNPGGIVSGGINPLAELDEYLPHKTSLL